MFAQLVSLVTLYKVNVSYRAKPLYFSLTLSSKYAVNYVNFYSFNVHCTTFINDMNPTTVPKSIRDGAKEIYVHL